MPNNPVPLKFPLKGMNEQVPYSEQQAQQVVGTDQVLNVRPFDSLERRLRGGQRTGITKFFSSQVAGDNEVQTLIEYVEAVPISQSAAWGSFLGKANAFTDNILAPHFRPGDDYILVGRSAFGSIGVFAFSAANGPNNFQQPSNTNIGSVNDLGWNSAGTRIVAGDQDNALAELWKFDPDTQTFSDRYDYTPVAGTTVQACEFHPDGTYVLFGLDASPYFAVHEYDEANNTVGAKLANPSVLPGGSCESASWAPNGDFLAVQFEFSDDVYIYEFDKVNGTIGNRVGNASAPGSRDEDHTWSDDSTRLAIASFDDDAVINVNPDGSIDSVVSLPNVAGGDVRSGGIRPQGDFFVTSTEDSNTGQVFLSYNGTSFGTAIENPAPQLSSDDREPIRFSNGGDFIAQGDGNTGDVLVWQFNPPKLTPSARTTRLMAVAAGTVKRSNDALDALVTPANGTSALNQTEVIQATVAFQDVFFADRRNPYTYFDAATDTVKDWNNDLVAGSLPTDSGGTEGCRIITTYRGRIVMAGLQAEPQNWFMSKAGDPFDWDYSPSTTSSIQAVAGNNSDAGELGDIITALVPFQDDLLIMGGPNSLWVMRGDPAAGGQIDNISRRVGIAAEQAWAWTDDNILYFLGFTGLYRMDPGGLQPNRVSEGRLDKFFADLDFSNLFPRLLYDADWDGIHVFLSPASEPSNPVDHIWYDIRSDSFWRDQYPTAFGPTVIEFLDAGNTRATLLGGYDGYIRRFSDDASDDDGNAIDSFVRFPPMHPGMAAAQFQLSDLQIHTDEQSDPLQLDYYRGRTVEAAALSNTSQFNKTLAGGRNLPVRYRLRGHALQVRIRNNTINETWAYEDGMAVISGVGRQRAEL